MNFADQQGEINYYPSEFAKEVRITALLFVFATDASAMTRKCTVSSIACKLCTGPCAALSAAQPASQGWLEGAH